MLGTEDCGDPMERKIPRLGHLAGRPGVAFSTTVRASNCSAAWSLGFSVAARGLQWPAACCTLRQLVETVRFDARSPSTFSSASSLSLFTCRLSSSLCDYRRILVVSHECFLVVVGDAWKLRLRSSPGVLYPPAFGCFHSRRLIVREHCALHGE
jgi:hypothetical protein